MRPITDLSELVASGRAAINREALQDGTSVIGLGQRPEPGRPLSSMRPSSSALRPVHPVHDAVIRSEDDGVRGIDLLDETNVFYDLSHRRHLVARQTSRPSRSPVCLESDISSTPARQQTARSGGPRPRRRARVAGPEVVLLAHGLSLAPSIRVACCGRRIGDALDLVRACVRRVCRPRPSAWLLAGRQALPTANRTSPVVRTAAIPWWPMVFIAVAGPTPLDRSGGPERGPRQGLHFVTAAWKPGELGSMPLEP